MNNLNSEYIKTQVSMINKDRINLQESELNEKYSEFKQKYPKIWEGIFAGVFSIEKFDKLVKAYTSTYTSTNGEHKQKKFESDKNVGELLAQEYLYPVFGIPQTESRKKATDIAVKKSV